MEIGSTASDISYQLSAISLECGVYGADTLDRLGRNLRHLINTVHELTERSVGLKVLTGQGAAIDSV